MQLHDGTHRPDGQLVAPSSHTQVYSVRDTQTREIGSSNQQALSVVIAERDIAALAA